MQLEQQLVFYLTEYATSILHRIIMHIDRPTVLYIVAKFRGERQTSCLTSQLSGVNRSQSVLWLRDSQIWILLFEFWYFQIWYFEFDILKLYNIFTSIWTYEMLITYETSPSYYDHSGIGQYACAKCNMYKSRRASRSTSKYVTCCFLCVKQFITLWCNHASPPRPAPPLSPMIWRWIIDFSKHGHDPLIFGVSNLRLNI